MLINTRGTDRCEISCFIFLDKREAYLHQRSLDTNMSFMYIETVSFRSREEYKPGRCRVVRRKHGVHQVLKLKTDN